MRLRQLFFNGSPREFSMTGRAYYLTTLGAWRRHSERLANSHWLALNSDDVEVSKHDTGEATVAAGTAVGGRADDASFVPDETTPILALIEADEGAHLTLQDDSGIRAVAPSTFAETSFGGRRCCACGTRRGKRRQHV